MSLCQLYKCSPNCYVLHRYAFTIIGSLVVFVCFWVLLEKLDNSQGASHISSSDKNIFWVCLACRKYSYICLTHVNVWESMGKPCSCIFFTASHARICISTSCRDSIIELGIMRLRPLSLDCVWTLN